MAEERAALARVRSVRATADGQTMQLVRGEFHRHTEISSDGGGDGMLMDMWRYARDAASLDWIGCGDHDNGGGREYPWWITQKTTEIFHAAGAFSPMYTYERSCNYPDGHRNAVFAQRGVRTLPRLVDGKGKSMDDMPADAPRPHSPDTQMLYRYLEHFGGVCASHTSGTDMGTDWRDSNAKVEPIVEIFQGCRQNYEMPGAPRSNTADDSAGGWRPLGFVSLAFKKGIRLSFESSSDHGSTHISYCNVWAPSLTNEGILAAMQARHVYGSTDNIVADFRCGDHFMGDEFTTHQKPALQHQTCRHGSVRQGARDQGRQLCLHGAAEKGGGRIAVDRPRSPARQDQLLLRPRRAGRRPARLGFADVDYLPAIARKKPRAGFVPDNN